MKVIYALFFLVLLSLAVNAQENKVFFGGAYAGLSASQLSGDQHSGFNKAGVYVGAFVNIHVTEKSAVQMELSYVQKGSRAVSKTMGLLYSSNLQYFEVPLLYKWSFSKRFGLEAGPALGYLIKNTDVEEGYDIIGKLNAPFNRLDFSGIGGFVVSISPHLKCDIRFSQSLIRIRKHESGAVYRLNRGQYNSLIGLTLHLEY